jgi:hypothetical protein
VKQSIQFEMHTKSENRIRGRQPMAIYAMHNAQREKVAALLTKHIAKPPAVVGGESNQYVVTLCRISAGELDEEDNLRGALKHVKDAIARWLGFRNDNDKRLRWRYQQQSCPRGFYAVRVTIEDTSDGDERETAVGKIPSVLGPIVENGERGEGVRESALAKPIAVRNENVPAAVQQALPFRRVFIAYPWDLPPGAADDDLVITEHSEMAGTTTPPEQLQARIPKAHVDAMLRKYGIGVRGIGPGAGPRLVFERLDHEDEALGGKCWLYVPVDQPKD